MKRLICLIAAPAIITVIFGSIYVAVQQSLRLSANDPQIQLAEDTAARLAGGTPANLYTAAGSVDIAKSLAPFVIIYDNSGNQVVSQAKLDGNDPVVPPGVITSAQSDHDNRVTWQPRGGVRIAAVVVHYPGGYVLAGRSLREVEKREQLLTYQMEIGWLMAMLVVIVAEALMVWPRKRG